MHSSYLCHHADNSFRKHNNKCVAMQYYVGAGCALSTPHRISTSPFTKRSSRRASWNWRGKRCRFSPSVVDPRNRSGRSDPTPFAGRREPGGDGRASAVADPTTKKEMTDALAVSSKWTCIGINYTKHLRRLCSLPLQFFT